MSSPLSSRSAIDAAAPAHLFEMRVYETRPGCRDRLMSMFEAVFRPLYESAGACIVASFVDLDAPDRWVWFRTFPDADARGAALTAFYTHPRWLDHRRAANALIARSSDARLLHPEIWRASHLRKTAMVECIRVVGPLVGRRSADLDRALAESLQHGGDTLGLLASSPAANTYPRQRLRREPARVWLAPLPKADDGDRRARGNELHAALGREVGDLALHRFRLASTESAFRGR